MVGDEAKKRCREKAEVSYPVDNGIVQNWDDMELLWDYTFKNKLNIDPRTCKVSYINCNLKRKYDVGVRDGKFLFSF